MRWLLGFTICFLILYSWARPKRVLPEVHPASVKTVVTKELLAEVGQKFQENKLKLEEEQMQSPQALAEPTRPFEEDVPLVVVHDEESFQQESDPWASYAQVNVVEERAWTPEERAMIESLEDSRIKDTLKNKLQGREPAHHSGGNQL